MHDGLCFPCYRLKQQGSNVMHVKGFLHKMLSDAIHNNRLKTLSVVVEAAIYAKQLSLTALGRSINSPIQERSAIQKVNRLLGNKHLALDYIAITKTLSRRMIGNKKHPNIIVDWTKYPNSHDAIIRAAIGIEGRALTVYEERHPEKKVGNGVIQKEFLINLKKILPENCHPIIVTDAGFHNPWFKQIVELGWDYVGRVRGTKTYKPKGADRFEKCIDIYKQATQKAKALGKMVLTERNGLETHFYLIKQPAKKRKAIYAKGKWKSKKDSQDYARSHREPWLLVSSLCKRNSGKKIIRIYRWRMSIEEAFRDLKSTQYGFGLKKVTTLKEARRDIVLLIAMLANLVVILTGIAGEKMKLQYQFQSNSIRHRRVISVFYLGCQMIRKKIKVLRSLMWQILTSLEVAHD